MDEAGYQQFSEVGFKQDSNILWNHMGLSSKAAFSMRYKSHGIYIYNHIDNEKSSTSVQDLKYFFFPTLVFKHETATSLYNPTFLCATMEFEVEMFTDHFESIVTDFLKEKLGKPIEKKTDIRGSF